MGINKKNPPKPMIGEACANIETVVDKMLHLDRYRSREIHIMVVKAIMNRRQSHEQIGLASGGTLTNLASDYVIGINREVWPVLFYRRHRNQRDPARRNRFIDFVPGHRSK